jgi:hypothetical protein
MKKLDIIKQVKVKDLIAELEKLPKDKHLLLAGEQNTTSNIIGIEHSDDCVVLLPLDSELHD